MTPYSKKEKDAVIKFYLQGMSTKEVVNAINQKFWAGKPVRTIPGIEKVIYRAGVTKDRKRQVTDTQNVLLYKKLGYSNKEISEILNIPVGTVKSSFHYANKYISRGDFSNIYDTNMALIKENNVLRKEVEKLKNIESIVSLAIETHVPILRKIPNCLPPYTMKKTFKEEVMVLELGDIHYGEKVVSKDIGGLGSYNKDVFLRRLKNLYEAVMEMLEIQRSKVPIKVLEINLLGDFVTGENIYIGQQLNIDAILVDQLFELQEYLLQELFLPIAKYGRFETVRLRAVNGNHGRIGKKGEYHYRTNFDYILYKSLKRSLTNYNEFKFYISESPFMLYEIPEAPQWRHLIVHGDEVKSWMNVPYYGIDRAFTRYVQLLNTAIHYLHIGHHHNKAIIDVPYGEKIINGSFVGATDFSVKKLQILSQPKQLLFGFNNRYGITWSRDIRLDDPVVLKKDKNNIYTPIS